ncbi:unnamed protein product [Penicillium salamii]|uniref:Zn(2)-C6 fungal-type domain-containing protein n=1 Tax=Penicillium salamii TaxID=1612424 RepID=A0A9W4J4W4_9EURO|nr:unnamed protein product [Penicillium salamii]CAG8012865.1 unnamed protein product [Penicillium salamii]CAG8019278.1 unnamed protein product [Penicillium salamii]CAG8122390.1 unnamed protein product [Penicillium salamii]CAG8151706.1 unnamed protein product [Penicillium salamii]
MSTNAKRKRALKACIPCHQRKRKCDTVYPCGMCTTYGYTCKYNDHSGRTASSSVSAPPAKQVNLGGEDLADETAPRRIQDSGRTPQDEVVSSTRSSTAATGASPGIFDDQKIRYSGASAAMAFPHILGVALGSDSPPKMRSYAYNFGVRPEESSNPHCFLGNIISEEDLASLSDTYFSVFGPVADLIDPKIYAQRYHDYYRGLSNDGVAFSTLAAGIAALGSFLSPVKHPKESELVKYAKEVLDDPVSMRLHGVDHILAWGIRLLYLRATTRPSNAWIASCTEMHLCEAIGLHEEETVKKIASLASVRASGYDADRLRRIFWFSWAGHIMLSYEYDRSPVVFRSITCRPIVAVHGSITDQFVKLIQIIPSPNSPFQPNVHPITPSDELFRRFQALDEFKSNHPFLAVTKADIAFCFYRRMYQLKVRIPDDAINAIIHSGNEAVKAAEQQASAGHLFWNVIGSVFQYTCILLAIDTPAASTHISSAFKGLENLVKAADTGLTREALSMARHLLSLNMAKKRKELAHLESVEAGFELIQSPLSGPDVAPPDIEWAVDWDQFFIEPYMTMFSFDA